MQEGKKSDKLRYDPEIYPNVAVPVSMSYTGCGIKSLRYYATVFDGRLYILAREGIAKGLSLGSTGADLLKLAPVKYIQTINLGEFLRSRHVTPSVTNSTWIEINDLLRHPSVKINSACCDLCNSLRHSKQFVIDSGEWLLERTKSILAGTDNAVEHVKLQPRKRSPGRMKEPGSVSADFSARLKARREELDTGGGL